MSTPSIDATPPIRLLIHGGAGTLERSRITPEQEAGYRAALTAALLAGYRELNSGNSSVAAVVAAVRSLEDSPLFNAGRGSVFNHEGGIEMDASVMEGATRMAGAVAGVSAIRNPVVAAEVVMRESGHVLLIGDGAEQFARLHGVETAPPEYFHTEMRWRQLLKARASESVLLDHDGDGAEPADQKFGTVGAVALDRSGQLAAATSTGGLTNKRFGRVGDSPIIGAGTFADSRSVAVSATGTGEMFIRATLAYDVAARLRYGGESLEEAARHALAEVAQIGGDGGLIALDRSGNASMCFNTEGMYRGEIGNDGIARVAIYGDEE